MRTAATAAALACAAALALASAQSSPRDRALALVAQMTLDEKIDLVHGLGDASYTGSTAAIPRLAIPPLRLNDGRQGFRPNDGNTGQSAFPCQLAVVATWRPTLMHEFGQAMAEEFYGKGANVVLAPMLILARVPQSGRTFESVGEDPVLAHAAASSIVTGIQAVPGVICNADDYVLNNQEFERGSISAGEEARAASEEGRGGGRRAGRLSLKR
jgi:beta-glucosidase